MRQTEPQATNPLHNNRTNYWCSAGPTDTSPKRPDAATYSIGPTESFMERSGQGVKLTPKPHLALLRLAKGQLYCIEKWIYSSQGATSEVRLDLNLNLASVRRMSVRPYGKAHNKTARTCLMQSEEDTIC